MASDNEKITIFVKALSGDLFEIDAYPNSTANEIAVYVSDTYPDKFLSGTTRIVKSCDTLCEGDIVLSICEPCVAFKKMFTRDNSMCLHIGVKLFDCIQNAHFYDDGEEYDDVDIEHLKKIYEKFYKGTSIRGPAKMGIDSNRLNITKKSATSNDYMCSMGNYGANVKGNDLKNVLSSVFEQNICHPAVNEEGVPLYKMTFQFKPFVIDQIVSIASTYFT